MGKKILTIIIIFLLLIGIFCGCVDVYERSPVEYISISPNGAYLASVDLEGMLQIWNISNGEVTYSKKNFYMRPSWLPDGEHFILLSEDKTEVYKSSSGDLIMNLSGSLFPKSWSLDKKIILTTNGSEIILWNDSFFKIKTINITEQIKSISLSLDGTKICYFPRDNGHLPKILNISDGNISIVLKSNGRKLSSILNCYNLYWCKDGYQISTLVDYLNDRGNITFYSWNTTSSLIINNITYPYVVSDACLSPDCTKFIYADTIKKDITMVDITSKKIIDSFNISKKSVRSVDWSLDGSLIAAGSNDGIIKVWDAETGELIQTLLTPKDHRVPI